MSEERVSGNIFVVEYGMGSTEEYVIRNRIGQGWGLPTVDLEPKDLRALADRLEKVRLRRQKNKLID